MDAFYIREENKGPDVCFELVMTTMQTPLCLPAWDTRTAEQREESRPRENAGVRRKGSDVHNTNRQQRRRSVARNKHRGEENKRESI